ncbi:hypothetical protein BDZ91DRAFT_713766 [Kalaharituber pfeilii]|nr:hypothetical protein BDZ91DRAFT_713766 [Kalaharituber pfeilii]
MPLAPHCPPICRSGSQQSQLQLQLRMVGIQSTSVIVRRMSIHVLRFSSPDIDSITSDLLPCYLSFLLLPSLICRRYSRVSPLRGSSWPHA